MKKFNFTPIQEHHLKEMTRDVAADLISLRFVSLDEDARTIRNHVYLQAKLDLLRELTEDDYPQPELEETTK